MSHFLMLGSTLLLIIINEGLASDDYKYVPAKPNERPPCAQDDDDLCETVDNYPEELIRKLLKTTPPELLEVLSNEDLPINNTRQRPSDIHDQFCEVTKYIKVPRVGRNVHNEWRYIVNLRPVSQLYPYEVCKHFDADCGSRLDISSSNLHAMCTQKRMKYDWLVLHPSGKKLELSDFISNTCCECTLFTNDRKNKNV